MTSEIKWKKLTLYSKRFFINVVPCPSMTRSGKLFSYLNMTNEMTPIMIAQSARHMSLGSCFIFTSGVRSTITMNSDSINRARTQNHVAFAIELSVMKKGIPLNVSVCNKSSIPTVKNKYATSKILLDFEKLNVFHPYEKIEKETAILKNSRIVCIAI